MEGQKLELVKEFKYLGFTWTSKMSLRPTIDRTLGYIQKSFSKLRWMKGEKTLSKEVLRRCFSPTAFHILLGYFPKVQKELFLRKFRNGLRPI
jgi:hypothetical protein